MPDYNDHIPGWDGHVESFQTYQDEVRIWTLSQKLEPYSSLAAKLVGKLKGPARRLGMKMSKEDLMPIVSEKGPPDHDTPISKLIAVLQRLAPSKEERRGNYMRDFIKEDRYKRRTGERIADWIPRWDEGLERLKNDGADVGSLDNTVHGYTPT